MIRGVIFDLGSTLIRFDGDWNEVRGRGLHAMLEQFEQEGLAVDGQAFAERFNHTLESSLKERESSGLEIPTESLLRLVLAQFGKWQVEDGIVKRVVERMFRESEGVWKPMPGLIDVLDELKATGYRLGIISNAGNVDNVQRLIDNAGIRGYFDPILISAAVGIRKPHALIFETVLKAWDLPAREVVMIGDMLNADIAGAQQTGMRQIWLTADADNESNRADAHLIVPETTVERLRDVPAAVKRMHASRVDDET